MHGYRRTYNLLLLPIGIFFVMFLLIPLVLVFVQSIYSETGITIAAYLKVFTRKVYRNSILNSLLLAGCTAFIGTVIGVPLSYAVYKMKKKGQAVMTTLLALPLTFSGLVIAYAFIICLGASGFFTILLSRCFGINPVEFSAFLYTWKGLVIAYLYFLIPRMILVMITAWSNLDWSLLEAAESLGAGRIRTFFRVLLPIFIPSVLAGSSLLFAVSMGAFGTAFALAGTGVNILPLTIYTQISDVAINITDANALAIILALITTVVVWLYEKLNITYLH